MRVIRYPGVLARDGLPPFVVLLSGSNDETDSERTQSDVIPEAIIRAWPLVERSTLQNTHTQKVRKKKRTNIHRHWRVLVRTLHFIRISGFVFCLKSADRPCRQTGKKAGEKRQERPLTTEGAFVLVVWHARQFPVLWPATNTRSRDKTSNTWLFMDFLNFRMWFRTDTLAAKFIPCLFLIQFGKNLGSTPLLTRRYRDPLTRFWVRAPRDRQPAP